LKNALKKWWQKKRENFSIHFFKIWGRLQRITFHLFSTISASQFCLKNKSPENEIHICENQENISTNQKAISQETEQR